MSITLYRDKESTGCTFTQSEPNLPSEDGEKFKIANVTAGTWIFYTDKNYNKTRESETQSYKKVEGGEKHVDITDVNGSMFLVDEGLILFEHFGYGGERKWFQVNQKDLTGLFPNGPPSGVSSAILLSKKRSVDFFTGTNFEGKRFTMQPGEWCEKLNLTNKATLGPNDNWLSLKFYLKA